MLKILIIVTSLYLLSGCSQLSTKKTPIDKHIDESIELQHLMHSLNMSVYEKNRTELELDDMKKRYAKNIVINIEKAVVVLDKYGNKSFQGQQLKSFLDLSADLGEHAKKINHLSQHYKIEELDVEIEKMKLTCISCHNQFRD